MTDINPKRLKDDWSKRERQTKSQWGKLTDNDLLVTAGQREQLVVSIRGT
jgi:uncharacterized protein YjbJ (UPF0337 family)